MPLSPRRAAVPLASPEPVRLEGVGFGYINRPDVLRNINLVLTRGSFHFLTGPSGAGKSSLLRLLNLAERPTSGRLSLFGSDVTDISDRDVCLMRRRMGMVFQDFRLLDHLDAFENAALPLRLAGRRRAEYANDVREMLNWVGLSERINSRPAALSGGEQQRLAIARAVMAGPELIIADEPTGSVDPAMADRLMVLFQSLNRQGTTVLIASHDEHIAARSGATVLRLDGGMLHEGLG
ncbi:MAG: cell division ATP-binding protein FtsE [Alphaproteobacteria bacterium]|nr:MAG: cell division ATP-binding protein FtsE [Alphaproteobacteria bacterium]PZO37738.1 MAG: cell division ATP-binding protein FtsE [Alphaproteobacteria bacterium]